jgi:dihydroorotase
MEAIGMPLLIHDEDMNKKIDIYDRKAKFIENILNNIRIQFPKSKIVLEHVTTKEYVKYIRNSNSSYLGGTITPHHLICNRNNIFSKGIQPYFYLFTDFKKIHIKEH